MAGLLKVLSSALYPSLTFENSVGHIAKIEMYSNELYFITGTQQTVLNATGLSLGTNAGAGAKLQVRGIDATSSNFALKVENSTPTNLFSVRNDGVVIANNLPTSAAGLPAGAIWRNGNVLNIV